MRPSRVFRLLFRIFIYVLMLSVIIVSFLGLLSAVKIFLNYEENIQFDEGNFEFYFEINYTSIPWTIEKVNFTLPFNITNAGYYDLKNLELKIEIAINYSEIDYPVLGMNETKEKKIFEKTQYFGTIPKGTTRDFNFTGPFLPLYWNITNFPDFTPLFTPGSVNWYRTPPDLLFYANLTVSLDYSVGMHSLSLNILDIEAAQYTDPFFG